MVRLLFTLLTGTGSSVKFSSSNLIFLHISQATTTIASDGIQMLQWLTWRVVISHIPHTMTVSPALMSLRRLWVTCWRTWLLQRHWRRTRFSSVTLRLLTTLSARITVRCVLQFICPFVAYGIWVILIFCWCHIHIYPVTLNSQIFHSWTTCGSRLFIMLIVLNDKSNFSTVFWQLYFPSWPHFFSIFHCHT